LKKMANEDIVKLIGTLTDAQEFNQQDTQWKLSAVNLLKQYADFVSDIPKKAHEMIMSEHIDMKNELMEILGWGTTPKIIEFISAEISKHGDKAITEAELNAWMDQLKKDMGIKGKPLF